MEKLCNCVNVLSTVNKKDCLVIKLCLKSAKIFVFEYTVMFKFTSICHIFGKTAKIFVSNIPFPNDFFYQRSVLFPVAFNGYLGNCSPSNAIR
jgi:hypothetical protein